LNDRSAKRILVHIGIDPLAPTWGKPIKLVVGLIGVAVSIALQVRQANVRNHVYSFKLGELLE